MSHSDIELILVRHGETVGQSSIRLYGATDVGLSDLGCAQMRAAGRALDGSFDRAVASPLSRSQEGARLVLDGRGPELTIVEAFREIDFGDWEGWTVDEARERAPEVHARWEDGGLEFRFPGGERRADFHQRVLSGLPVLLAPGARRVLGVLHTGVIRVVIGELLGLSWTEQRALLIPLGSIFRLRRAARTWELVSRGDIAHLEAAE